MFDYEKRHAGLPVMARLHRLEVVLVVAAVSIRSPEQTRFLVVGSDPLRLPTTPLAVTETSVEVAAAMLKELTGVEARIGQAGWAEMPQLGVADQLSREEDGQRHIAIVFACLLPAETATVCLAEGQWLTLPELAQRRPLHADHWDLVQFAASYK